MPAGWCCHCHLRKKIDTSSSSLSLSTKVQVVTFADHPNQLKNYNFPKCVFGNEKQVILLKKENIKDLAFTQLERGKRKDATVACPQHALSMTQKYEHDRQTGKEGRKK